MPVNTVISIAVLTHGAGIHTRQIQYGLELFLCGLVLVDKLTGIAFGAGPAQEVIVAQFVVVLSLLDRLEHIRVDIDGLVQTTGSRIPLGLGGLLSRPGITGPRSKRHSDLWRRADRLGLDGHPRVGREWRGCMVRGGRSGLG